ncbi:uncharacterized protein LOC114247653 [Bombyx mandarina]|uniref:Uncharacterized protein LOC114247653 n=1 Tax=Bombyx mandarina TaxID=7092 RepID=A0A6J2K3H5_BOMMA|nr:uncharacterized protein LOC114247653 [Bombyx mandarina]
MGILGVDISSVVQFGGHLESKAKMASKKLGVLNRAKQYFKPAHRLKLYKAQVRPHMEYCCHLWAGALGYQLSPFDRIQRRASRIVDDPELADRKKGRQPKRWEDEIKSVAGPHWSRMAKNRKYWQSLEEVFVERHPVLKITPNAERNT